MIKGRDIIVVGQQPWDTTIGSNCKNIAQEFSKYNRVLYVNSPLDRNTLFKSKKEERIKKRLSVVRGKTAGLIQVDVNLWNLYPDIIIESINWIGNQTVFEFFNRINNKRFAKSILKAMQMLGFKNCILFNDNDMFRCFHLKEFLQPAVSVYYSRDFMLAVDYWKKHGEKMEPALITKSDVCVANSTYLADYCRTYNTQSYYVGQGCELDMFTGLKDKTLPHDILSTPAPRIGYVGALLGLRLDIKLLESLALTQPDWSIILVGPEDELFSNSSLHQMKNVYFLGAKTPDELPKYIQGFDICLNPQIISTVTIGNYPRKIDEYLAMGKPVVATSTPFMQAVFSEYTYLGTDATSYTTLIEKALKEDSAVLQEARRAFASTHTWENSVNEIYQAIKQVDKLYPAKFF